MFFYVKSSTVFTVPSKLPQLLPCFMVKMNGVIVRGDEVAPTRQWKEIAMADVRAGLSFDFNDFNKIKIPL